MKKKFQFSMMLFLLLGLGACSRETRQSSSHFIPVEAHAYTNTLFYSGIVQPLKTTVIASPADGVIIEMPFQYGESVQEGDLLFKISSAKFLTDYKTALMQYLKAKNEFNGTEIQLTEANFLHQHQLISEDEYKTKKSNYYMSQLSLFQARDSLEVLIRQLDIKDVNLYQLTITDMKKISEAMHLKKNAENLRIAAPVSGRVLSPIKSEEESKKIIKGDAVKEGDVLAVIGDMSGLIVKIKVNELTVNQLKIGQRVRVSGIAFADELLQGQIMRIDKQGESVNGGLPAFPVAVMVPRLTLPQQKIIHTGMSAKIEIDIEEEPQILVPLTAVLEKNGQAFVTVYDKKTKQTKKVSVKTGKTTAEKVAILSGIQPGETILVID